MGFGVAPYTLDPKRGPALGHLPRPHGLSAKAVGAH